MGGGGAGVGNMTKSLFRFVFALVALALLPLTASAQDSQPMTLQDAINGYESVTNGHAGVPEDWSTHHLVFSQPTPGTAAYDRATHDPRYWQQQIRRSQAESEAQLPDSSTDSFAPDKKHKKKKKAPKAKKPKRDWAF
jgi:hypothetical protein